MLSPFIQSRDHLLLEPKFLEKLQQLIARCEAERIQLKIGTGIRGPGAQGWMWCRSRSAFEVEQKCRIIKVSAPTMASFLRQEFAALGPPMTESLPGQSWHQWGEAADVYAAVGDAAAWSGTPARIVRELCKEVGLYHGLGFHMSRRHWHVQLREEMTPLMVRGLCDSWADVEAEMLKRFDVNICPKNDHNFVVQ